MTRASGESEDVARTPNGRRHAVFGLLVGCAFSAMLLAVIEIGLRWTDVGPVRARYPTGYFVRGRDNVTKARPGVWTATLDHPATGQRIYEATYTVDEFGRRVTPVANRDARDKFVLFFGCSMTYGEGLDDDETLAYHVGTLAPSYMPYNYAFHGGSPYDALARLDTVDFPAEVAERRGIGLYVYQTYHVNRVADAPDTATWHYNQTYYERTPDGRFVMNGTYETARPYRTLTYQLLGGSRLAGRIGLSRPFGSEDDRLDITADALAAVAERFAQKLPGAQFYVVNYPTGQKWKMGRRLTERGVKFLDYAKLFNPHEPRYHFEGDGHATALATRALAEALVRDLGLATATGAVAASDAR